METEEGQEEDSEEKSEAFVALYDKLVELLGDRLVKYYYDAGYENYRAEQYVVAIPSLRRAYQYDNTKVEALFYLGNRYHRSGDDTQAKEIFAEVIDNFPDTEFATRAETAMAEINNAD